jgi:ethanolaminephosphotransferase
MLLQTSIQFSFFMAQWEEYHTHVLPHCTGKWCGVTEVNYSLGIFAFVNSCLDRVAFYQRPMKAVLVTVFGDYALLQQLPAGLSEIELRYFLVACWGVMLSILMILSLKRVMFHPHIANSSLLPGEVRRRRLTAVSKLASPFALCVAGVIVPPNAVRTRYLSVTLGLAFSLLTKKMIVFSMAKMAFAVVQWDAVPIIIVALWIRLDARLSKMGADFVLGVLCFWYAFRMLRWVNVSINQICKKLNIYCFRLKKRKDD